MIARLVRYQQRIGFGWEEPGAMDPKVEAEREQMSPRRCYCLPLCIVHWWSLQSFPCWNRNACSRKTATFT